MAALVLSAYEGNLGVQELSSELNRAGARAGVGQQCIFIRLLPRVLVILEHCPMVREGQDFFLVTDTPCFRLV